MREKVKGKLRSRQGMTLLLSLLLFLVCAVAGSVALTAGTASSGTISERAELDQRYFSVMSAAELLRETFDGKSVTVTVEHDKNGQLTKRISPDPASASAEEKFVIDQSLYLLSGFDDETDSELERNAMAWLSNQYTVTVTDDRGKPIEDLQATVEISQIKRGAFEFTVTNAIVEDEEKFSLKIECSIKSFDPIQDGFTVQWEVAAISSVG